MPLAWEYMFLVSYCMEAEIKTHSDAWLKIPIPAACPPHEPGTDWLCVAGGLQVFRKVFVRPEACDQISRFSP